TRADGAFSASRRRGGGAKRKIGAYDTPTCETGGGGEGAGGRRGDPAESKAGPSLTAATLPVAPSPPRPLAPSLPAPWLVTPAWVEARRREWGAASDAFRVRVLGEFPRASADSLIELAWVEAAEERGGDAGGAGAGDGRGSEGDGRA